ncbi:MAG: archemetzincin, partial [Aigarchaeota archaeon]|nr:archemetzincin [Candidatus Calditenuaceae archaeon]
VEALSRESGRESLRLHITQLDIYFGQFNFCFGLASNKAAVVSTYRLRHRDSEKYIERLRKEAVHEVGHILGLGHCPNPRCVMFFSNSILDTDMKGENPCPRCLSLLK